MYAMAATRCAETSRRNEDESSAPEDKGEAAAIFSVHEGQVETFRHFRETLRVLAQRDSPCERKRHDTSGNRWPPNKGSRPGPARRDLLRAPFHFSRNPP